MTASRLSRRGQTIAGNPYERPRKNKSAEKTSSSRAAINIGRAISLASPAIASEREIPRAREKTAAGPASGRPPPGGQDDVTNWESVRAMVKAGGPARKGGRSSTMSAGPMTGSWEGRSRTEVQLNLWGMINARAVLTA
jgi:hypothetical protein